MEMADAIYISKADGDNINKANQAKTEYKNALHLFPPSESGWLPQVGLCSAQTKNGVEEIWETIKKYEDFTKSNGYFHKKRQDQKIQIMFETIHESLKSGFYQCSKIKESLSKVEKDLLSDKISSYIAAQKLMDIYLLSKQTNG
jgi:LAO/AO transport system kinase